MEVQYKGYTITIEPDLHPESPREHCNIGTMICFHTRYDLGDTHAISENAHTSWEELEATIVKKYNTNVILPIYMYDHSGITISTTPFSCRWDSGQVGFIVADRVKVEELMGWRILTQKRKEQLLTYLSNEVEAYDTYLRGDIVGFEITDKNGDYVDSCWGYYAEQDAIHEAKSSIDANISYSLRQHLKHLKQQIVNKVPLLYRKSFTLT